MPAAAAVLLPLLAGVAATASSFETPAWPPPAQQQDAAHASPVRNGDAGFCLSVTSFGALGDGEHDDTPAFQKAADAADAVGGG
eukprot:COSAG05_NODE_10462_length_564_cov_0.935484_1_plen_83_part_10